MKRTYDSLVAEERLICDATEAICEAMQAQGVTRVELARRIGKTKGFVSQVLSGKRNMTLRTLARMASAVSISVTVTPGPFRWRCKPDAHYFGGGPTCDCGERPLHLGNGACLEPRGRAGTMSDEFVRYVKSDEFRADLAEASRLIQAGDTDALAEFVSRNVDQRASEAVARLREARTTATDKEQGRG